MKKLLNTLYVTSENGYLGLEGETIVIYDEQKEMGRIPLHNLDGIISFGYRGTSPALMGACAERNIALCYLNPQGKFLARVVGKTYGNVLLRKQQYISCMDQEMSLELLKIVLLEKYIMQDGVFRTSNSRSSYADKYGASKNSFFTIEKSVRIDTKRKV